MRKYLAATAAASVALVVASCSGPDQVDAGAATSPSASVLDAPTESGPEPISTVQTCAGFYDGGEYSVDHRVTTWGPQLDALTEEGAVEVTVTRDRLASLLLYAGDEATPVLEAIQVPFQNALENGVGNPDQVEEAAAELRTLCEDAGYAFTD